ncbi:MAG: ATP-binding protein [Polyangiaceae bacterium]
MKRLQRSVGFKLFASIFVSMAAVFLAVSAWSERRSEEAWRNSFDEHARQTSAVLERALRYGMLLKKEKGVHSELADLAEQPGVKAIRIFDKKGKLAFSSRKGEEGNKLTKEDTMCQLCHAEDSKFHEPLRTPFSRTFRGDDGKLVMSHIHLIENSRECTSAPCHAHTPKQKSLGVLDLQMDMAVVDGGRVAAQKTTAYATVLMALVGGLVTAAFVWVFVRRPVQRLVAGTERVAAAGLDTRIAVNGTGEFADLATAFNRMTEELERAQERTSQWESQLEAAVQQKTEELERAHGKLMQMEKMASLGKLAATVAHELNNPLAGILVYAKLVAREIKDENMSAEDRVEALRCVEVIQRESTRCGDIVKNLLTFARQSKADLSPASLTTVVERSVQTVEHLIKHGGVDFTFTRSAVSDEVSCDSNQIQQALVALIVNAVEAMPSGGELTLSIEDEGDDVVLVLKDTGIGIPPEVMPHVFEPFVSTKEEKGVGLGLAVVYGIVRRHGGQIDVESELDKGTTFRITLPRHGAGASGD